MIPDIDLNALSDRLNQKFAGISNVQFLENGTLQVDVADQAECPVSSLTLEQEILEAVQDEFPAVKRVQAGPTVSKEAMDLVYQILRGKK